MTDPQGTREHVLSAPDNKVAVVSPYAGGGGGSTLGHRVATSYLADMLLGAGRPETDELPVAQVAFQTNPTDPIDDLRVEAGSDESRLVVHIAARRSPQFTESHPKTGELVKALLDQIDLFDAHQRAYVAVAVAGMTPAQRGVQLLASLARDNASEAQFHDQVHKPGRHADLANRYKHLTALVAKARPGASPDDTRQLVWSLLNRLWILGFRVESDDETDWAEIGNRLNSLARTGTTGLEVRDYLHTCASQFDQKGTVVDRTLLRRKAHSLLNSDAGRSPAAWAQLDVEQNYALVAVRHEIAGGVKLPRTEMQAMVKAELFTAGKAKRAIMVTGESGTGKSALTVASATALAAANSNFQCVVLNLRRTRDSAAALSSDLGMPLHAALSEMTAPSRVLVVDAADAAAEGRGPLLRELASAAKAAGAGLALVAADTASKDAMSSVAGIYSDVRELEIPGLSDDELRVARENVPAIAGALSNLPAKSLYRRLAVVDLLARTGVTVTTPLGNWECLDLVWENLIGRTGSGSSAGARTDTLLAMSEVELELPAAERKYLNIDNAALDALRADLLVSPSSLRRAEPAFAHDEVRRYATAARLARAESITDALEASGPKRWSMSAAKLACEGQLSDAENPGTELEALVTQFDALGDRSTARWKDVPLEAALERPNAYELFRHMVDVSADADDLLANLVRVATLHQRHDNMVDALRGEAVVRLLIEEVDELWRQDDDACELLCEWLQSALADALPTGNATRQALRGVLLDRWQRHLPPTSASDAPLEPDGDLVRNVFDGYSRPTRRPRALSWEITQERFVQLLALLGPDINDDVRDCLSRIAAESPSRLQPAVDLDWSAWGLSSYDPKFLLELTEAYYIDNQGDRGRMRWNGIRDHQSRGFRRLNSHLHGSFWVLNLEVPSVGLGSGHQPDSESCGEHSLQSKRRFPNRRSRRHVRARNRWQRAPVHRRRQRLGVVPRQLQRAIPVCQRAPGGRTMD